MSLDQVKIPTPRTSFDAEYQAQQSTMALGTADMDWAKFFVEFLKTGSFHIIDASTKTHRIPNIRTLLKLYLMGYSRGQAFLMNAVVKEISEIPDEEITDKDSAEEIIAAQHTRTAVFALAPYISRIWKLTYPICAAMRLECSLRHCLLDKFLSAVCVEGTMSREQLTDEAIFPQDFQKAFSRRLERWQTGQYKLSRVFLFEFPTNFQPAAASNLKIKASDPLQMHDSALKKLKTKRDSASVDVNVDVDIQIRDPELHALEVYLKSFPNGSVLVQTSTDKFLCGLDSINKSTNAQLPVIPCPTVSQMQEIVATKEWEIEAGGGFLVGNGKLNKNLFKVDQLAKIFQTWGQRHNSVLQLGWLTDDGLPHLVPCQNEDEAKVIWIHNDDAEATVLSMGSPEPSNRTEPNRLVRFWASAPTNRVVHGSGCGGTGSMQ